MFTRSRFVRLLSVPKGEKKCNQGNTFSIRGISKNTNNKWVKRLTSDELQWKARMKCVDRGGEYVEGLSLCLQ